MPVNTSDQQITIPIGVDTADNPVAFVNQTADVEQRLVRRYVDEADRTARMVSLSENDISTLSTENRVDVYNGATHISLYTRALFARPQVGSNQNLTMSSTALQNVTALVASVPTAGTFGFRGIIFYSSSTTADIKFAFNIPAGSSILWTATGVAVGGTGTGDFTATTAAASDATISIGGNGVGTILACQIEGTYVAGGTAGNLQFRAAQNTSDATQSVIHQLSRLEVFQLS